MAGPNPVYRALVLLAALNVVAAGRREGVRVRPLLVSILLAAGLATAFNALLGHSGRDVIVRLPAMLPVLGGALTVEGVAYGAAIGLGLAAAVLAVAPLSLCLEPDVLVAALPRYLQRTGAALGAAFNLVPALARSLTSISEAQRLRGMPAGLRGAGWVLVPATLSALDSSLQLAESMEARGYGSGPRTSYAVSTWGVADSAVAISAVAAAVTFLAAHALGLVRDWYPYPELTLPAVSGPAVVACLLLALPALLWRSRPSSG